MTTPASPLPASDLTKNLERGYRLRQAIGFYRLRRRVPSYLAPRMRRRLTLEQAAEIEITGATGQGFVFPFLPGIDVAPLAVRVRSVTNTADLARGELVGELNGKFVDQALFFGSCRWRRRKRVLLPSCRQCCKVKLGDRIFFRCPSVLSLKCLEESASCVALRGWSIYTGGSGGLRLPANLWSARACSSRLKSLRRNFGRNH